RLCVKGMYDAAIEEGLCLFNPAVDIRVKSFVPKQKKSTYSAENVDALFLYASNHKYGLGVCLLLDLGLRCSEMLGLQWRDVDFVNHCIDVSRASVSVDGKAYVSIPKNETSVRTLPLSSRLERLLYCAWLQANRPTDDSYIVPAPSGAPYTPANFTKNRYNVFFKDANTDLGLQRLSPHELRHTCGTNLYARSGDISAVSAFLGHSSVVVTTKFYVHISTDMMRKRLQI
ncbi:MAG: site-specific integrase, partial [Clostridia bacterium]|nr:site-specific integrase [Clostridia bacterium]